MLNTCNKASKCYNRTRQEVHKDQWLVLQGKVATALYLDQQVHLDAHLAALGRPKT